MKVLCVDPIILRTKFRYGICEEANKFIFDDYSGHDICLDNWKDDEFWFSLRHLLIPLEYCAATHNFTIKRKNYFKKREFVPKLVFFNKEQNMEYRIFFDEEYRINNEKSNFLMFLITSFNFLRLDYSDNIKNIYLGNMDKLSEKDTCKRINLTFAQKYIIIAKLLYLFCKREGFKDKEQFYFMFQYVVNRFIHKSKIEADFLLPFFQVKAGPETEEEKKDFDREDDNNESFLAGYNFICSTRFRSPVSSDEINNIYNRIVDLYTNKESYKISWEEKEFARKSLLYKKVDPQCFFARRKRKWNKYYLEMCLSKFENQSEMARFMGISRQRISILKLKK